MISPHYHVIEMRVGWLVVMDEAQVLDVLERGVLPYIY